MKLKIPPPIVALLCLGLMFGVRYFSGVEAVSFPGQNTLATVFAATGALITFLAMKSFRRAKTTVNPLAPEEASSLVQNGIFKISRNPMYLGLVFVLISAAIWLGVVLNVFVIVFNIVYITIFQIKPEEEAMSEKFGSDYEDYRAKVRRWI